jgi:hypothetical protein
MARGHCNRTHVFSFAGVPQSGRRGGVEAGGRSRKSTWETFLRRGCKGFVLSQQSSHVVSRWPPWVMLHSRGAYGAAPVQLRNWMRVRGRGVVSYYCIIHAAGDVGIFECDRRDAE